VGPGVWSEVSDGTELNSEALRLRGFWTREALVFLL